MGQRAKRGTHAGLWGGVGLGIWIGAIAPASLAATATPSPPFSPSVSQAASTSVTPAEGSQESLMRELAQPPFFPTEIFSDLPYAVPAPVMGGLGVEIE